MKLHRRGLALVLALAALAPSLAVSAQGGRSLRIAVLPFRGVGQGWAQRGSDIFFAEIFPSPAVVLAEPGDVRAVLGLPMAPERPQSDRELRALASRLRVTHLLQGRLNVRRLRRDRYRLALTVGVYDARLARWVFRRREVRRPRQLLTAALIDASRELIRQVFDTLGRPDLAPTPMADGAMETKASSTRRCRALGRQGATGEGARALSPDGSLVIPNITEAYRTRDPAPSNVWPLPHKYYRLREGERAGLSVLRSPPTATPAITAEDAPLRQLLAGRRPGRSGPQRRGGAAASTSPRPWTVAPSKPWETQGVGEPPSRGWASGRQNRGASSAMDERALLHAYAGKRLLGGGYSPQARRAFTRALSLAPRYEEARSVLDAIDRR